MNLVQSP